ncbi:hypothetical protein R1CP_37710 (plasmid) [Rhodococcus opacus]|uniref:Uncharacterized protein n=1 Tax=Rhodococcus opacus TaxID=37919 RepID=A0A1B1KHP2_RHOOP|nr:hypothetical protein R1CP_37710 [Rhodococcus opacus]
MITAQAPPFHRSGTPARGYTPPLNLFGFASPPRSLRPIEGAGVPQAVISPTRQCPAGYKLLRRPAGLSAAPLAVTTPSLFDASQQIDGQARRDCKNNGVTLKGDAPL